MTQANDLDGTGTLAYSESDAANNGVSPGEIPDGTSPSNVKLIFRALMGALKRAFDRDHAGTWCTVGGTANAITLTYSVPPVVYAQGQQFAFKATAANSGATTLTPNSGTLAAKNVFKKTSAGAAACAGNEIQNGDIVKVEYDGTQFQIISDTPQSGGVTSIADATNGGINVSASTGAITIKQQPSDLLTKATRSLADSVSIMDAAASNVGKTQLYTAALSGMPIQIVNTITGAVATGTTAIPFDDTIPQNTEGDQYMSLAITPTSMTSKLKIDVVANFSDSLGGRSGVALFQDSTVGALAAQQVNIPTNTANTCVAFAHFMTAGTTSATTFKVRIGSNSGGTTTFNGVSGGREYGGVMASSITIAEILS